MTIPYKRAQQHYPIDTLNVEGQSFQNIPSSLAPDITENAQHAMDNTVWILSYI